MQLPRASTSALADGYCVAIVAESLASVSAVDAVDCCAVVCRAGNPAAMKSEMPIAAIEGRALPIALPRRSSSTDLSRGRYQTVTLQPRQLARLRTTAIPDQIESRACETSTGMAEAFCA